ncbi:hypothetical protein J4733_02690 [Klebsiella pneumoniae]|uniref:Uncharacterized protein n=1 Tax=Klebsiella pneumoniae TaxID=573 RepID=A0A939SRN0_KLEPN|nr:hypothetical protein [Klebsiella pneumoniae]
MIKATSGWKSCWWTFASADPTTIDSKGASAPFLYDINQIKQNFILFTLREGFVVFVKNGSIPVITLFAEYLPFSFLISEAIHHIFPSPLSFLLIQEIRPQLRRIACLLASSYGSGMQYIHLNAEDHSLRIVRARGN